MRTTFALFQKYDQAKKAVADLLDKNIHKEAINIIAQKDAVEGNWNVNERTIDTQMTKDFGGKTVSGLDAMLGSKQPMTTNSAGPLYASGERADILARSMSVPGTQDNGLESALEDFGVRKPSAEALASGVMSGELLVFVRTPDERTPEVEGILSGSKGQHIESVIG